MIAYLEKFLALVERFVIATEQRNKILASQQTTIAQDVAQAEKHVSAAESTAQQSASNGSASDAATETRGRGRSRAAVAGSDTAEAGAQTPAETPAAGGRRERVRAGSTPAAETASTPAATGGRRERVRAGAGATEQQAAGTESTAGATAGGRRERVRAGATPAATPDNKPAYDENIPEPVNDTPEQADDRAEIESIVALCGDVDEAAAEVKAYWKANGWTGADQVPSHQVEDVLADFNEIADKYFD